MRGITRPRGESDIIDVLERQLRQQNSRTILVLTAFLGGFVILIWTQAIWFTTASNWGHIGFRTFVPGLIVVGLTILTISGGIDSSGVIHRRRQWWTKWLTIGLIVVLVLAWVQIVMVATSVIAAALVEAGVGGTSAVVIACACSVAMGGITSLVKRLIHKLQIGRAGAVLGSILLLAGRSAFTYVADNVLVRPSRLPMEWSPPGWLADLTSANRVLAPIVFVGVLLAGLLFIRYTGPGNHLYAIGGDPEACRRAGVRVDRIRAGAWLVVGLLSGFAGIAHMSRFGLLPPGRISSDLVTAAVVAVLLGVVALSGGRGSLLGASLALLVWEVTRNGMIMTGVSPTGMARAQIGFLILAITLATFRRDNGEHRHGSNSDCEPQISSESARTGDGEL
ncbi:MAG: hypothetical protein OXH28_13580 [bacterium]|nr:hypothetical protein [bacterium]